MTPAFTLVNNIRYGYNSARHLINNLPMTGLVKIAYKQALEQENTHANDQRGLPVGWVYGEFNVDGFTLSFLKQDSQTFTDYLASLDPNRAGFIGSPFTFMSQCDEPLAPSNGPITIVARGCRVTGKEDAYEPGAKALVDVFTLMCLEMSENGKTLYDRSRNRASTGPGY